MDNHDLNTLSPYLSLLVSRETETSNHCEIHRKVLSILKSSNNYDGSFEESETAIMEHISLSTRITTYTIQRIPGWCKSSELMNTENHLLVSFLHSGLYAFYLSDSESKNIIRETFGVLIKELEPIDIGVLLAGFVNEQEVKTLWLKGVHGRSKTKANSKVISGDSIIDALDPLIDQSYMMSAARTRFSSDEMSASYGINPFKSVIWRGRCNTWDSFEKKSHEILNIIATTTNKKEFPISILSYPVSNCTDLKDPYDFHIEDMEAIPTSEMNTRLERLYNDIQDLRFELERNLTNNNFDILTFINNDKVCRYNVSFTIDHYDVSMEFSVSHIYPRASRADKRRLSSLGRALQKNSDIIKVWFESGHAIVANKVFRTAYRDVTFTSFKWADFSGYDITQEKPTGSNGVANLALIGNGKSLFCFIRNYWSGILNDKNDFILSENSERWLYCDDGAQEKADFIHITSQEKTNYISLIHVKASPSKESSRKLSVGAHSLVLSQAIKNIRSCYRENLINSLRTRVENGSNKQCWHNKNKVQPSLFISHLASLSPASTRVRVVIIQPHTVKATYEAASSNIKTQLDVLLVNTQNAVKSANADFFIIGSL